MKLTRIYSLFFVKIVILCEFRALEANQLRYQARLPEKSNKSGSCYGSQLNSITHGECGPLERAVVYSVIAGVKNSSSYTPNNGTSHIECEEWSKSMCCQKETDDCYGEYEIYADSDARPYIYHEDCIGRQKCLQRSTAHMDSVYLNCSDDYPKQTAYLDIDYYCVNVNRIKTFSSATIRMRSIVYLWGGMGENYEYTELPEATYNCSIETYCDDTIRIISVDFRLAELVNGTNFTCIQDNKLTIIDGNQTYDFNCSNINKFLIQDLYVSKTNYIFLSYTGVNPGGHLWLGLKSSSNGNIRVDCQPAKRHYDCRPINPTNSPTVNSMILIAIIVCVIVIVLGCFGFIYYKKKKQKEAMEQPIDDKKLSHISDGVSPFIAQPFIGKNLPPRHGQLNPLNLQEGETKKKKKKKDKHHYDNEESTENGKRRRRNRVHPSQDEQDLATNMFGHDTNGEMNDPTRKQKKKKKRNKKHSDVNHEYNEIKDVNYDSGHGE